MAEMTHEYSMLPDLLLQLPKFKDIADADSLTVTKLLTLKEYQSLRDYKNAREFLYENQEIIPYMLTTDHMNALFEEVRNLEIMALDAKQDVFYTQSEPTTVSTGSVWIGG